MIRSGWRFGVVAVVLVLAACAAPRAPPALVSAPGLFAGAPPGREDRVVVIAVANPVADLPRIAGSTPGVYGRRPRYVAGGDAQALLAAVVRSHRLVPLAAWPIEALGVHCATLLVPEGSSRDEVLTALRRDPRVALAQPLNRFDALTLPAPPYDDPYLPLQRSLRELGVLQAHRCARGEGTRIAVVDTGVNTGHPDLRGMAAATANFVDRDTARFERDLHGTEVAGVIAARPGNALGIVGIAPEARLIALKACWEQDDGSAVCNSFTLAQALSSAIDSGAQVVNLSLGGPADELLTRLVRAAQAHGAVVIGAQPPGQERDGFPVGIPGVIAAHDGGMAGTGLGVPAREVLTLVPGGRYDFASGSSMAAAQLSAIAALLLQRRPGLDGAGIERVLRESGTGALSPGPNACLALTALDTSCHCSAPD